jgi:hypothetical protein
MNSSLFADQDSEKEAASLPILPVGELLGEEMQAHQGTHDILISWGA